MFGIISGSLTTVEFEESNGLIIYEDLFAEFAEFFGRPRFLDSASLQVSS
jgi:hypothetical protein